MGNIISYFLDLYEDDTESSNATSRNNSNSSSKNNRSGGSNNGDGSGTNDSDNSTNPNSDGDGTVIVDEEIPPPDTSTIPYDIAKIPSILENLTVELNKMTGNTGAQLITSREQDIIEQYRSTCLNCYNLITTQYGDKELFTDVCGKMDASKDVVDITTFPNLMGEFIEIASTNKVDISSTVKTVNECFTSFIDYMKDVLTSLKASIKTTNEQWNNTYGEGFKLISAIENRLEENAAFIDGFDTPFAYVSANYNNTGIEIVTVDEPDANTYVAYFTDDGKLVRANLNLEADRFITDKITFEAPNGVTVAMDEIIAQPGVNETKADEVFETLGIDHLTTYKNVINAILTESNIEYKQLSDTTLDGLNTTNALITMNTVFSYLRDVEDDGRELKDIEGKLTEYYYDIESYIYDVQTKLNEKAKLEEYNAIIENRKIIHNSNTEIYNYATSDIYTDFKVSENPTVIDTKYEAMIAAKKALSSITIAIEFPELTEFNEANDIMRQFDTDWYEYEVQWKMFKIKYELYDAAIYAFEEEYITINPEAVNATRRTRYTHKITVSYEADIGDMKKALDRCIVNANQWLKIFDDKDLKDNKDVMVAVYTTIFTAENSYNSQFNEAVDEFKKADSDLAYMMECIDCIYEEINKEYQKAVDAYSKFSAIIDDFTYVTANATVESNRNEIDSKVTYYNSLVATINANKATFDTNYNNAYSFAMNHTGFDAEIKSYEKISNLSDAEQQAIQTAKVAYNSWKPSYDQLVAYQFTDISQELVTFITAEQAKLKSLMQDIENSVSIEWERKKRELQSDITVKSSYNAKWNLYSDTVTVYKSNETLFGTAYSTLTGRFDEFYNSCVKSNASSIATFDANIAVTKKELEVSYNGINKDVGFSTEILNINTSINNIFSNDIPDSTMYKYNIKKNAYKNVESKEGIGRSKIKELNDAFADVQIAYNTIINQADGITTNINKLNESISNKLAAEAAAKEAEAKQKAVNDWNDDYNNRVTPLLREKTDTLSSFKTDVIMVPIDCIKNIVDLSDADKDCNDPDISLYKFLKCKVGNCLDAAEEKSAQFTASVGRLKATVKEIENAKSDAANTLNGYNVKATIENIETIASVDTYIDNVNAVDLTSIEASINSATETSKQLVSDYNEIYRLVMNCANDAMIEDAAFKEEYMKRIRTQNKETLETYDMLLKNQMEYIEVEYNNLIYNYFMVQMYYVTLYNTLKGDEKVWSNTVTCQDENITTSDTFINLWVWTDDKGNERGIKEQWNYMQKVWYDTLAEYASRDMKAEREQLLNTIEGYLDDLGGYTSEAEAVLCSTAHNRKTCIDNYNAFVNAKENQTSVTLEGTNFDFNTAETFYNESMNFVLSVREQTKTGIIGAALNTVEYCQCTIGCYNTWLSEQIENINKRKRLIVKYSNAARIISYVFGHDGYLTKLSDNTGDSKAGGPFNGLVMPWKYTLLMHIQELLYPYDYIASTVVSDPFDVFQALCLYPPMQAIVWPDGASIIEKDIQASSINVNGSYSDFFNGSNRDNLLKYIENELPVYITTGIIRTMYDTADEVYPPVIRRAIEYAYEHPIIREDADMKAYTNTQLAYDEDVKLYNKLLNDVDVYEEVYEALEANKSTADIINKSTLDDATKKKLKEYTNASAFYNGAYFDLQQKMANLKIEMEEYKSEIYGYSQQIISNKYWIDFIEKSREVESDKEFIELCNEYLEVPGKHLYWKIFRAMTGKFEESNSKYQGIISKITTTATSDYATYANNRWTFKNAKGITRSVTISSSRSSHTTKHYLKSFPTVSPFQEQREAVIIIANKIFNTYGYVTLNGEELTWEKWKEHTKDTPIIAGGQCVDYDDRNYYKGLSNGSSDVLVSGDSNKATSEIKYITKSTSFANVNGYMQFLNPTAEVDVIFNYVDRIMLNNKLANLGIGNYSNPADLVDKIANSINWNTRADKGNNYKTPFSSIDYIVYDTDTVVQAVFDKIVRTQYDWKLYFAYVSDNTTQPYRISKINSYTYSKTGQMIYDIFTPSFVITEAYAKGISTNANKEIAVTDSREITDNDLL